MKRPFIYLSELFLVLITALVVLAAASGCRPERKENGADIQLFGNVDIREVQLSFQDGGRIRAILVEEGALVTEGQVLAELDPSRYRLEVERLQAQSQAQAQVLASLRKGSRPQQVLQAEAAVDAAKASLREAEQQLARGEALRQTNAIAQQQLDSARARVQSLAASLRSANQALSLAREGARSEDIAASEATLSAMQASLRLAEQRLKESQLIAPASGLIRTRILEPGAMAAPGAPVLTLALTQPIWIRTYVSEPDLGKVKEGMRVEVQTDSFPGKKYPGWVGFISSTAEFTPKTVETTELRAKLVYQARILACDQSRELRLGMPVSLRLDPHQAIKPLPASPCAGLNGG